MPAKKAAQASGAKNARVLGVQRDPHSIKSAASENSKYRVGDDIMILLDEVLNNTIRAVFVYDDFSGHFSDFEVYSLSVVFKHNFSVVSLTINGADIGDDAVSMLCESLVQSRLQYIDLTSTPLDDEAGRALAALAMCNPNLRTVVVDDTLISEEILDEIDMACTNNDVGNDVPPPAVIDPLRIRYCVAHQFAACPHGDMCIYSHAAPRTGRDALLPVPLQGLRRLPPEPPKGASWRPRDAEGRKLYVARLRRPESAGASTTSTPPPAPLNQADCDDDLTPPPLRGHGALPRRRPSSSWLTRWAPVLAVVLSCCTIIATAAVVSRRRPTGESSRR